MLELAARRWWSSLRDASGARCVTLVKLAARRWAGLLLQFATQRRCDVLQLATQQRCGTTVGSNVTALRQVVVSRRCGSLERYVSLQRCGATAGCNVAALW